MNPTNLVDRAEDWEADIIRYFEDHPNEKQLVDERDTPTGRQLYLAKPMRAGASCLECHSEPSAAPAAMIRKYGSNNGFGWQLNQVIAAQVVSVPMTVPDGIAEKAYHNLILFLMVVFVVTILALDGALYLLVIRPLHDGLRSGRSRQPGRHRRSEPLDVRGQGRNRRRHRVVQPHAGEPGEGAEDAGVGRRCLGSTGARLSCAAERLVMFVITTRASVGTYSPHFTPGAAERSAVCLRTADLISDRGYFSSTCHCRLKRCALRRTLSRRAGCIIDANELRVPRLRS